MYILIIEKTEFGKVVHTVVNTVQNILNMAAKSS